MGARVNMAGLPWNSGTGQRLALHYPHNTLQMTIQFSWNTGKKVDLPKHLYE